MEYEKLIEEFWELFILEKIEKQTNKNRVYKWNAIDKKRFKGGTQEETIIFFVIKSKRSEIKATYNLLEEFFLLSEKETTKEEFFQEIFSMIGESNKVKFLPLLEAIEEKQFVQKIFKPLFEKLMESKERFIKINWEVYEQVRRFWHIAEVQSFETQVTQTSNENWKRKEQVINNQKTLLTKKTSFDFLWEGEKMSAVLHYKEFDTGDRIALYPFQMTLDGGNYKTEELITYLYEKLPVGVYKETNSIQEIGKLNLSDAISVLFPLSNLLDSLNND